MSLSLADLNTVLLLNDLTKQINRYILIIIFIAGFGGNLVNLLIFSHQTLRPNPCAWIFLVSSIGNMVCVTSGVVSRILSGWSADLTNTVEWLCKMRVFLVWSSRAFVMWTLTLASVDRWLLSCRNVHHRHISSMKNTYRGVFLVLLFSLLISIELIVCYEANLTNTPLRCYVRTEECRLLTDFTLAVIIYSIPLLLMSLFGLLTIRNVRQLGNRRIHPQLSTERQCHIGSNSTRTSRINHVDRRLLRMLLLQILVLTITTLPFAIQRLYSTLTLNTEKSLIQQAVENFAFNLLFIFNFAACGTSFFIFTLSGGRIFRTALRDISRQWIGRG